MLSRSEVLYAVVDAMFTERKLRQWLIIFNNFKELFFYLQKLVTLPILLRLRFFLRHEKLLRIFWWLIYDLILITCSNALFLFYQRAYEVRFNVLRCLILMNAIAFVLRLAFFFFILQTRLFGLFLAFLPMTLLVNVILVWMHLTSIDALLFRSRDFLLTSIDYLAVNLLSL